MTWHWMWMWVRRRQRAQRRLGGSGWCHPAICFLWFGKHRGRSLKIWKHTVGPLYLSTVVSVMPFKKKKKKINILQSIKYKVQSVFWTRTVLVFSRKHKKKTFIEKKTTTLLQGIYLNWNSGLAWGASQAQCVLPGAVKCAKKKQVYPLKQLLLFTFQKTPKALKLPFIFAFAYSFSAALIKKMARWSHTFEFFCSPHLKFFFKFFFF